MCRILSRVTGGLTDDEQGGFRAGRGCVEQIFILKQIPDKAKTGVYHVPLGVQCIYGWSDEVSFMEDGREWRLPGLLYTDDLVL